MTRFVLAALAVIAATAAAALAGCGDGRARFRLYGQDTVVGAVREVRVEQPTAAADLARKHGVHIYELLHANPPLRHGGAPAGATVRVPGEYVLPESPRRGIVVNLPEMRLYYFPGDDGAPNQVLTFPVALGRDAWKPETGRTHVAERLLDPQAHVPPGARAKATAAPKTMPVAMPARASASLGRHVLRLGWDSHLIHGADGPLPGEPATHGCIHLYPEDMALLFEEVRQGVPVTLIDEPYKFGVRDGAYYVEAHPPGRPADAETQRDRLMRRLAAHASDHGGRAINWASVVRTLNEASGVPERVSAD